jgi:L-iditol 2-dehydrogenase
MMAAERDVMRALILYGPDKFQVEPNWPIPPLQAGWTLVRVAYAGICGSDMPRFLVTGSYHHPIILGHEFAGFIETPAPGSPRFQRGQAVAVLPLIPCGNCAGCRSGEPFHCVNYQFLGSRNDGGYAEYCLVPEENLVALPEGVSPQEGAFLEPLAVALHVVRRAHFMAGQTALVFGAGPIGLLVGLWLKVFGARQVVMADVRADSMALARRLGFEVVDASQIDPATAPRFDLCFEAAGARAAQLAAIQLTRPKGEIVVVGRDTQDTVLPHKSFEVLMRKELSLVGCWGYNFAREQEFVLEMLRQHRFPLTDLITHEISLDQAPAVIRAMASGDMYYCKVLIKL